MKETRYFYVPDAAQRTELPADEAAHAVKVLRLTAGDELMLMDGKGLFCRATLTGVSARRCIYRVEEQWLQQRQWPGYVHLAMAPTKMADRTEWMVEKATEVGVDELSFLDCRFSERRTLRQERIERIVVAAMKQSHKAFCPRVNAMTGLQQFVDSHQKGARFIAHCYEEVPRQNLFDCLCRLPADSETTVLIGPEGDFSIGEVRAAVAAGYTSVSLGASRLRTETAGLSAVMMMQLAKQVDGNSVPAVHS